MHPYSGSFIFLCKCHIQTYAFSAETPPYAYSFSTAVSLVHFLSLQSGSHGNSRRCGKPCFYITQFSNILSVFNHMFPVWFYYGLCKTVSQEERDPVSALIGLRLFCQDSPYVIYQVTARPSKLLFILSHTVFSQIGPLVLVELLWTLQTVTERSEHSGLRSAKAPVKTKL